MTQNTGELAHQRPGIGMPALLLGLLAVEVILFSMTGTNFASGVNAAEICRLSVEIGLLAIALTPVIVSGGIDLSVGSLMGLSAVVLGKLSRDIGLPIWFAAGLTLGVGAMAGAINGLLIARLRIPPLIVTLGSMSLFRGLAEGLTRGVDNFTTFPSSFLFLGQGYVAGVPVQAPILVVIAIAYWLFLHRTIQGRVVYAIGLSPEGTRHAGIAVERRIFGLYMASGFVASLAAIVYVAHLGQAKADAGTNYELAAITAVVLGGTSIFGGRGGITGTVLGLLVISVLQIGLRLSDLPAELAGVFTGIFLLTAIGLDGLRKSPAHNRHIEGEFHMSNRQLTALCAAIVAAAALVAGSNRQLANSVHEAVDAIKGSSNVGTSSAGTQSPATPAGKRLTVAMMPKSKGNAYFIACRKGAEEAAKELNVELIWDGPTDPDPAKQNEVVDTWITRGVDVIAVAVENRVGISSVLRKARQRGIKVLTWDADAEPDSRDFFVNQATPEGIGYTLMDNAARVMGGKGEFAIITASLTASNMIEWQKHIEARRKEKYPDIKMAVLRPCDDLQKKAFDETNTILAAYPNVKLIMAICSPGPPGAAEAVRQSGRKDVKVIGLSLPNDNKRFVHEGITDCIILWNTADLGYLTIHAARQLNEGTIRSGTTSITAGRLNKLEIVGDNILLGKPFAFNKDNIDQFDF